MPDDELLLRIQSDVAQALSDIQNISQALSGTSVAVQNVSASANQMNRVFGEGSGIMRGFFDAINILPRPLQTAVGAMAGLRFEFNEFAALAKVVKDLTIGLATEAGEWAHSLEEMAGVLGLNTQELQAWQTAATAFGMGANTALTAIRFFDRALEQAAGGGMLTAREALQKLGISAREAQQFLSDPSKGLEVVGERLAKMGDSAERAAISIALFGRFGVTFTATLLEVAKQGGNVVDVMRQFGLIIDEQLVQGAAKFGQDMNVLSAQSETFTRVLGAAIATGLEPLARSLREEVGQALLAFEDKMKTLPATVAEGVDNMAGSFARLGSSVKKDIDPILAFLDHIAGPTWRIGTAALAVFVDAFSSALTATRTRIEYELLNIQKILSHFSPGLLALLGIELQPGQYEAELASLQKQRQDALDALNASMRKFVDTVSVYGAVTDQTTAKAVEGQAKTTGAYQQTQKVIDEIAAQRIKSEEERQVTLLEIQQSYLKQQLALHQITDAQEVEAAKNLDVAILAVHKAAAEQLAALPTTVEDPAKLAKAQAEVEKINLQIQKSFIDRDTAVIESAQKLQEAQQAALDKVAEYETKAYGETQQSQIAKLVAEHDKLRAELERLGDPDGAIARVDAAFGRMVSNAQGAVIDLTKLIQTGLSDAFQGIILGTSKMSDLFVNFRNSLVKQFSAAFAEVILKKLDFESQIRLNVADEFPKIGGSAAQGIVNPIAGAIDLLFGGTGRAQVSTDASGIATWVGGAPQGIPALASGLLTPAQASAVGLLPSLAGASSPALASGLLTAAQAQAVGILPGSVAPAAAGLGGIGGAAASGAVGALLLSALSGGGGPLGPVGPLSLIAGLTAIPGVTGSVLGVASPILNILSKVPGLSGLSGLGAAGGAAAGGIGVVPIVGWVLAAISGIANIIEGVNALNKGTYGAAGLSDQDLNKMFWSGVLGSGIAKSLSGIFGEFDQLRVLSTFAVPGLFEFLGGESGAFQKFGITTIPTPGTVAKDIFLRTVTQNKDLRAILEQYTPTPAGGGPPGSGNFLGFSVPPTYRGSADFEKQRSLLEGLGAIILGTSGPSPRGPYDARSIESFASGFIKAATDSGQAVSQFTAEVDALTKKIAGNLPQALDLLNHLFDPKLFAQNADLRGVYADAVAGIAQQLVQNLPQAAVNAIRTMALAGKVQIDDLNNYIQSVLDSANIAQNAVDAAVQTLSTQAEQQRMQDAYDAATRDARIKSLQLAIQQTKLLGDAAKTADLQMQLAAEQAAQYAQNAAAATLDPGAAFLDALTKGIHDTILTAIVNAIVQSGIVQVALAPVFAAITSAAKVLSDPTSTQAQIDAALAAIKAAAEGAKAGVTAAGGRVGSVVNALNQSGLLNVLGITTTTGSSTPIAAVAVAPAPTSTYATPAIHISLAGATILDANSASRLGRVTGEAILRQLKQNQVVGR